MRTALTTATLLAGLLLAGCAGQTTNVNLAAVQAQANAAVADLNAVGLNLVAQGVIPAATFAKVMQDVSAGVAGLDTIPSGTTPDLKLVQEAGTAIQAALAVLGPQVPAKDAALVNAAIAAIDAAAASLSASGV
jgi:hypothetical protein